MENNKIGCASLIVFVIVLAISIVLTKAIIEADIPVWVKFFLLH